MATLDRYLRPPRNGIAWSFPISLISQADTDIFQANPTLAAGDVKVSKDGGAYNNITTLPTGTANNKVLGVSLSALEMSGNEIEVFFSDAAGSEWQDTSVTIWTVTGTNVSDFTVIDVSDAVWDELLAGHVIVGSAGAILSAAGSASDPLLNIVPDGYAAGTAGYAIGRLGSGQIITTSIVAQSGNVETYRGDDYKNADGRAIDWTDASAGWPDLTGATILVIVGGDTSFAGSVVTPSGAGKKVRVELTSAQSGTIPAGTLDFIVRATLTGGNIVTLVDGTWISHKQLVVGS